MARKDAALILTKDPNLEGERGDRNWNCLLISTVAREAIRFLRADELPDAVSVGCLAGVTRALLHNIIRPSPDRRKSGIWLHPRRLISIMRIFDFGTKSRKPAVGTGVRAE